jgi:Mrp family chromosome partitioning ATPase
MADYVIIDTPPIGQVSDALRAAVTVDDIVLVTRPGNTDRTELQHTRELLDRMGHTPTGLLVIGEEGVGDPYGEYGDGFVEEADAPAPQPAPPRRRGGSNKPSSTRNKPVPYP